MLGIQNASKYGEATIRIRMEAGKAGQSWANMFPRNLQANPSGSFPPRITNICWRAKNFYSTWIILLCAICALRYWKPGWASIIFLSRNWLFGEAFKNNYHKMKRSEENTSEHQ